MLFHAGLPLLCWLHRGGTGDGDLLGLLPKRGSQSTAPRVSQMETPWKNHLATVRGEKSGVEGTGWLSRAQGSFPVPISNPRNRPGSFARLLPMLRSQHPRSRPASPFFQHLEQHCHWL